MITYTYYDDTDLARRSDAQKSSFAGILAHGLRRIQDISSGSLEDMEAREDGLFLQFGWDDYCRGCFMEHKTKNYLIPWDLFYSNASLSEWKRQEDTRSAAEEKAKQAAVAARQAARLAQEKEERDRREYERLSAKFAPAP